MQRYTGSRTGIPRKVYYTWYNMIARCQPQHKQAADYHKRGIQVCPAWRQDIQQFYSDIGNPPAQHYTLERLDNDGNYEPGNVHWATRTEQNRNSRHNRLVVLDDKIMCITEAAIQLGVQRQTLTYQVFHSKKGHSDVKPYA